VQLAIPKPVRAGILLENPPKKHFPPVLCTRQLRFAIPLFVFAWEQDDRQTNLWRLSADGDGVEKTVFQEIK
jgi:hypothetical protein